MYYIDTFAPIAKMDSIRLVLAIAASKRWEVHHMHVKSEFIHDDIQEKNLLGNLQFFAYISSCSSPLRNAFLTSMW